MGNPRQLAITGIHNRQFPPVFRGFWGFFGIINYTEGREFKVAIPSSAVRLAAGKLIFKKSYPGTSARERETLQYEGRRFWV